MQHPPCGCAIGASSCWSPLAVGRPTARPPEPQDVLLSAGSPGHWCPVGPHPPALRYQRQLRLLRPAHRQGDGSGLGALAWPQRQLSEGTVEPGLTDARITVVRQQVSRSFSPEPSSVRQARGFLHDFLREVNRPDVADRAELALSEVVTNAVLHAHTEFDVTLCWSAGGLRVEVVDRSPQSPVQRAYGLEATTGRGMELVAAVTTARGVEPRGATGKAVWFLVSGIEPEPNAEQLLDAWDDWDIDLEQAAAAGGDRTLVLLGMPPLLWLAAREHHDAILRELALYRAEHPGAVTGEDLALADRARAWISTAVVAALVEHSPNWVPGGRGRPVEDLSDARSAGPAPLDLRVAVGDGASAAFAALQDVLDAAECLAVAGQLLVRPGLPEIVAVRDWVCEQAIGQSVGGAASGWPGSAQERFTREVRDRAEPEPSEWDPYVVTSSERGAVAADDANRIVAVSAPLAQALGWDPAELVGRRVVALVPPRLREAHVAGFSRHLSTGQTRLLGTPLRLPALRADGTEIDCDVVIERAAVQRGRPIYVAWMTPVTPPEPGSPRTDP